MMDGALLVYEMNGETLPNAHGFPLRAIVPGIYGMHNVKWVNKIELVDYDYNGYWQIRGWADSAKVKTSSRYDVPMDQASLGPEEVTIGGVAFAGDRGISKVEYSIDDGRTWHEAKLKQPLSPYTWLLWTQEWEPVGPGEYIFKVRATDSLGQLQDPTEKDPPPDGASGYHIMFIRVSKD